ncbi:MSHA biogenesis protein MshJ [Parashewanella curva]|uniref:MSHA biogenesis protein MshJ n=1 Tax=Parashewanella curva TaxID=2338552 RepID=A0A3L8PUG8_9GAMM|nr:type 4a pilus biogenesis protein PilO [Parashewanella curva]RLV59051.1 MSHA biogenesis protein MshJ [Parashewanella curva]
MKLNYSQWQEKFAQLTLRERVLITASSCVLLIWLCSLPVEHLYQKWCDQKAAYKELIQQNQLSSQLNDSYRARLETDPNQDYRAQIDSLEAQKKALDEQLEGQLIDMVSATYMPTLLEDILSKTTNVKLTGLQVVAPVPVLSMDDSSSENLYRHGLKLKLTGDYFGFIKFVTAIDELPNKLYWKRVNYSVTQYPKAEIELELETVSINKELIRVANNQ